MAKRADKKPASQVNRNADRRNGKAYKKNPKIQIAKRSRGFRPYKEKRADIRRNNVEQKRNEQGHVIKRVDGHDILICDHPKNYVHCVIGKDYS